MTTFLSSLTPDDVTIEVDDDDEAPTQAVEASTTASRGEESDTDDQPTQAYSKSAGGVGEESGGEDMMETQAVSTEGYDPAEGLDSQSQIETQVLGMRYASVVNPELFILDLDPATTTWRSGSYP